MKDIIIVEGLGILFLIIGIIALYIRLNNEKMCTMRTIGKVIELKMRWSGELHKDLYYPVITYYANGQYVEVKDSVGTNPPRFAEGQDVELYYNPNNVEQFYISGTKLEKILAVIFIAIGIILVSIGIVISGII